MNRIKKILIMNVVFGIVSTAADLPLEQLIPREKWVETGIAKLSQMEQARLASEIVNVVRTVNKQTSGGLAVIAPSVSTSMMARQLLTKLHSSEVGLRSAESVLVVVRSSLYNPLMPGYRSVCDLQKDAESQLNIAGPNFHVYVYAMDDNLRVTQSAHQSFPADQ